MPLNNPTQQNFLIAMLKKSPANEREIGWNSAVISILQQDMPVLMNPLSQAGLKPEAIAEINEFLQKESKLAAVKHIKELTALGLREAKDLIDEYWATGLWR